MTSSSSSSKPQTRTRRWRITRRGFLLGAGAVGGSLALGFALGLPRLRTAVFDYMEAVQMEGLQLGAEIAPWA